MRKRKMEASKENGVEGRRASLSDFWGWGVGDIYGRRRRWERGRRRRWKTSPCVTQLRAPPGFFYRVFTGFSQSLLKIVPLLVGFYRVLLGFNGVYWVFMGCIEFFLPWQVFCLSFIQLSMGLLGFTGFYWVLLGFIGFYWVFLGCIEFVSPLQVFVWVLFSFQWGLLGYTGFYWVLLGFTVFSGLYWVRFAF